MRYLMKEKLFSFGEDFSIKDADGNQVFYVDGKAFSIGDKLSFQDNSGRELAFIKQRVLTLGTTYEIHRGDQVAAVVKKKLFTLFRTKFYVDVPGPNDLEAQGNFLEHEYTFRRGDKEVATVSKRWFSWTDTYGIDVAAGEDDVLILACAVVIDMACHKDED